LQIALKTDSEPALKRIPNLKNPTNFPNQVGNLGTKTHYGNAAIAASFANGCFTLNHMSAADDDIADTNLRNGFKLATCSLKLSRLSKETRKKGIVEECQNKSAIP